MPDRDTFTMEQRDRQTRLSGVIDEHADLTFLGRLSGPQVTMNLRGIRRINSYGVRAWLEQIRKVPAGVAIEFVEVPPQIVDQINMVHGFIGGGRISSFYVPYTCEKCEAYEERLVQTDQCRKQEDLPKAQCAACGAIMEVDDVEEQYLQILRDTEGNA